jgi:hypothetical protein
VNPVTVHLPQEWIDRIEAMAEREERTRQAQLRWLIRRALEAADPAQDLRAESPEAASASAR